MTFCKIGKTLLKNAFGKKSSEQKKSEDRSENFRGSIDINAEICTLCGECEEKCVSGAIIISEDEETWEVNRMQCVLCGECIDICPENCLVMSENVIGAEFTAVSDVFNIGEKPEDETEVSEEEELQAEESDSQTDKSDEDADSEGADTETVASEDESTDSDE
ncbi:MAG TPA: 4Fe-4S binding protein, partial [Candidatus Copromorpha excrementavium]|nr:4Fe-4S binding protein [Candidatus Copromorpha excrementavium]